MITHSCVELKNNFPQIIQKKAACAYKIINEEKRPVANILIIIINNRETCKGYMQPREISGIHNQFRVVNLVYVSRVKIFNVSSS